MTVPANLNRVDYTGTGSAGPFTVPFPFYDASHLTVLQTDALFNQTTLTGWTATGAGGPSGAVTLAAACPVGSTLTIMRVVPLTQITSIKNQEAFYPEVHEQEMDLLAMADQQLDEAMDRTLRLPAGLSGVDMTLPKPDPGHALVWNAAGDGLENAGVASATLQQDLADSTDVAKGDEMIAVKQPFTGAVARTQHDKNAEWVSVKDFGAVGDGVTNDTGAIIKALNSGARTIFFPQGTYLTDSIDLRSYVNLTLEGCQDYSEFQYTQTTIIKIRTACQTGIKTADDNLEIPISFGTGITIRNMQINANCLANTGINLCRAIKLENIRVYSAVYDGIVSEGGAYPWSMSHVNSQSNGGHGLRIKAPFTTLYTIRDCEFGFNALSGIYAEAGSTALLENVLCQTNGQHGFYFNNPDPAPFSQPNFFERITFINCYSEANAEYGIVFNSYNTNPATYVGKITDVTFINCSFNSGVAKNASMSGLARVNAIGTQQIESSIGIGGNTVSIDSLPIFGSLDIKGGRIKFPAIANLTTNANTLDDYREGSFTARISQQKTNYFTTSGTITAKYQKIGNIVKCLIDYSWSDKGIANNAFFAIIDELPFTVSADAQACSSASIRVSGGSSDIWHVIPDSGMKTASIVKNNSSNNAIINDLPSAGNLSVVLTYSTNE